MQKLKSQAVFSDSYLDNIFQLANQVKCPLDVQLLTFFSTSVWSANFSANEKCIRLKKIFNSDNTRSMTYMYSILNPSISLCPIYCNHSVVPKFPRLTVTRLRLSSHYLRIETDRWSRLSRK